MVSQRYYRLNLTKQQQLLNNTYMKRSSYERGLQGGVTRRRFLTALGLAGAAGAGYIAYDRLTGSNESGPDGRDNFEKELSGYQGFVALNHDQVLFVDADNVPVGGPVEFEDIIAPKTTANGEVIEEYRYSAGTVGEDGILLEPPTLEWREQMKARIEAEHPGRIITDSYNLVKLFRASTRYEDEPELQAGIRDGSIKSYGDLVDYYANKEVIGDGENRSRYEYVHEAIEFSDDMPVVVQEALRELIPGVCAQESKFNNGLTSSAGAIGIFQFMPEIWEKYGQTEEDIKSLKNQVEIAGKLFSDIYQEVLHHAKANEENKEEPLVRARSCFDNQETFLQDFLVPVIINSYNAGSARMGEIISEYFDSDRPLPHGKGKEIFLEMVNFAETETAGRMGRYGEHAREYVPRVYAHAISIHQRQAT